MKQLPLLESPKPTAYIGHGSSADELLNSALHLGKPDLVSVSDAVGSAIDAIPDDLEAAVVNAIKPCHAKICTYSFVYSYS